MIGVFFYIIIKELYFSLISVSKKIKSSDYSFFPILYNYKNSFISYAISFQKILTTWSNYSQAPYAKNPTNASLSIFKKKFSLWKSFSMQHACLCTKWISEIPSRVNPRRNREPGVISGVWLNRACSPSFSLFTVS